MKILQIVSGMAFSLGGAVFGASLLFMTGPLSVLGWIIGVSFFVGGTGLLACQITALIPASDKKQVNTTVTEKHERKVQQPA